MRSSLEIISQVLGCATEADALKWETRMNNWDAPDWSEISAKELQEHILNFVLDWLNVYEKAELSTRTVHSSGSGGAPDSLSDLVVAPPHPNLQEVK